MKRLKLLRGLALILSIATMPGPAFPANEPPKPPDPARTQDLLVDPKGIPSTASLHRLLPLESERTPGDAAPIYLRLDA